MGATIHTHIEYKTADGRWLHYAAPHVKPNYRLFALIAGIRNEDNGIQPMLQPRGLPEDMSEMTQIAYDEDSKNYYELKGKTWLYADEFFELQKHWNKLNPSAGQLDTDFEETVFHVYGPGGGAIASHNGFEDARIIFWFDD